MLAPLLHFASLHRARQILIQLYGADVGFKKKLTEIELDEMICRDSVIVELDWKLHHATTTNSTLLYFSWPSSLY